LTLIPHGSIIDSEVKFERSKIMNRFKKFCPNVWVGECEGEHKKGDVIILETKHGKKVECTVYNLIANKNGLYYYSIVRVEEKTYAERKAERYNNSVENKIAKSNQYYEASKEGAEFLSLGEPIKVGHHSEKRHRALIERNNNRMSKSVELAKSAEDSKRRAEYWEAKANTITLAMPDSIDFYSYELEKAVALQKGLKDGSIAREHSYSLPYATKAVKELKKKCEIAKLLWE
jgi:rRNA maturation protein Rpf1